MAYFEKSAAHLEAEREFNEAELAARKAYGKACEPVAKYAPSAFRPNPGKYYAVEKPAREVYEAARAAAEAKLHASPGYEEVID